MIALPRIEALSFYSCNKTKCKNLECPSLPSLEVVSELSMALPGQEDQYNCEVLVVLVGMENLSAMECGLHFLIFTLLQWKGCKRNTRQECCGDQVGEELLLPLAGPRGWSLTSEGFPSFGQELQEGVDCFVVDSESAS